MCLGICSIEFKVKNRGTGMTFGIIVVIWFSTLHIIFSNIFRILWNICDRYFLTKKNPEVNLMLSLLALNFTCLLYVLHLFQIGLDIIFRFFINLWECIISPRNVLFSGIFRTLNFKTYVMDSLFGIPYLMKSYDFFKEKFYLVSIFLYGIIHFVHTWNFLRN